MPRLVGAGRTAVVARRVAAEAAGALAVAVAAVAVVPLATGAAGVPAALAIPLAEAATRGMTALRTVAEPLGPVLAGLRLVNDRYAARLPGARDLPELR